MEYARTHLDCGTVKLVRLLWGKVVDSPDSHLWLCFVLPFTILSTLNAVTGQCVLHDETVRIKEHMHTLALVQYADCMFAYLCLWPNVSRSEAAWEPP